MKALEKEFNINQNWKQVLLNKVYDLSGNFPSMKDLLDPEQYDVGHLKIVCKRLGLDTNKYKVIWLDDANNFDSFNEFDDDVYEQLKQLGSEPEEMHFDKNDPDYTGVDVRFYDAVEINNQKAVVLYDAGMTSFIVPNNFFTIEK